ncbi:glycosyltransferase family 25 protein [Hyphomicrobium sp.]|jgi:glycosyl transferase family 25|uniref:glycosyltransferase family 25 protein n=1 Tax=Hyphomicrobium sp. TaxID=82 RepID=UPI002C22214C|nr:glycosyltransferase family 25 protein [Hyphomicrobium sp.]HVZ05084.1 glycosyltransferase family 25 protein [Hyphomicrobium sp.]
MVETATQDEQSSITVHAIYINLDRHPERRIFIEEQIAKAGITAERFRGVDGKNYPPRLAPYFPPDSTLTAPQIGCTASRLEVMRLIVERGMDAALVLEDDARISTDLGPLLEAALRSLPPGWDIVRLCNAPKRAFRPLRQLTPRYQLVRYSRIPLGTAGYLVSQSGARKLLKPRPFYWPGDVEIAHPWVLDLDVYGVVPPPVLQERDDLPSTIGVERGHIPRWQRGIPDPRRVVFNVRKLGFSWWLRCLLENAGRFVRPIPGTRTGPPL